jgi:Mor family transcriptional regulator
MLSKNQPPPSFIVSVGAIAADCLTARLPQVNRADARAIAGEIAGRLRQQFAGCSVYVPADRAGERAERDRAIRAAFARPGPGGTPAGSTARLAQLAKHHQLTERRVRSIVASAGPIEAGAARRHNQRAAEQPSDRQRRNGG